MKALSPPRQARFGIPSYISIVILGVLTGNSLGNWDAAPIDVHEWGVNTFDWNTGKPLVQDLPDYLYTDKRPGASLPSPKQRVRDLPPDSGIRTKPLLYFYPSQRLGRGPSQAKVGIEMRFAYGYANAWWPQVNRYRTEEISQQGEASDWKSWKTGALENWKKRILQNNKDGKAAERWEKELAEYRKLNSEDQIKRLAQLRPWGKLPRFPEDGRMQLVWEEITLHPKIPTGQVLPGEGLGEHHWVKIARDVDAAYVSNSKETERYLFYEGKTSEEPAIALLPANGGSRHINYGRTQGDKREEISLVNVGEHTLYDVMAIYRDVEKGILWTAHLPVMQPRTVALRIPDFNAPREDDNLKLLPEDFQRRTSERLIENLTVGTPVVASNITMRDPADRQGATQRHQLFRKEALGLKKIWHDDFFEADGFTLIYRESPEYLDEAMPLNIFTSMYWHIRLSRCGLVLNRNIPLEEVHKTERALWSYQLAGWNKQNEQLQKNLETALPQLKKNRLLTLGQARFYGLHSSFEPGQSELENIRKLIE